MSSRVESIELRLTDLYKKLISLPSTEQIETELALLNESIEKFTHIDINKLDQVKTDILLFDELVNKLTEKVDSLNITNIEESLNHHKHTSKQQMKDIDNSLIELTGSTQQNKLDLTGLKVDLSELKGSTQQNKVDLTGLKVDLTELKGSTQQNKVDLTKLKGSTQQNKVDLTELKGSTRQMKVDLTELKGSTQQNKVVLTELKGSTQQNKFELTELKGLVNKHNLDLQACAENVTALKQKVGECETMYPRLNEVEGGVKDVKAKLVLVESSITNLTSLSTRLDQHQLILNALNDKPNKTTFEAIETQTKIDIAQVKAMIIRESNALKTNITSLTNTISKIQASLAQQQFVDVNAFNSKTKQLTISINDLDGALKQITSKMTDLDQIKAKTLILDTLKTTTDSLQQRFTELHDLTSHLAEKDKERTEETNVWVPLMTQQSTELQKLRENLNVTTTSVSDNLKELVELHNKFTLFESKTDRGLETCSESVGELEKSVNKIEGVLRGIPSFFSLNSKAMFFAELKKSLFFSPGIVLPKTVEIKSLYITTNRVPKQTRLFELSVVANGVTTVLDSFEKPSTDEVIMQDYLYSLQVDAKSKILISCDKKITAMAVLTMQYI